MKGSVVFKQRRYAPDVGWDKLARRRGVRDYIRPDRSIACRGREACLQRIGGSAAFVCCGRGDSNARAIAT